MPGGRSAYGVRAEITLKSGVTITANVANFGTRTSTDRGLEFTWDGVTGADRDLAFINANEVAAVVLVRTKSASGN